MSASCTSRVRLLVSTTSGGCGGLEHAELGDRDLPVGQDLEQVGLELVVGAVDLVDQQHRRRTLAWLDRPQQRPLDQEPFLVQLGLQGVGRPAGGLAGGLGGPEVEELASVVPVVDGLGGVDALVALQPDQLAARPRRQDLGQLGLADPGLAFDEQRPAQRDRQVDRRRQPLVGQVAVGREGGGDLVDRRRGRPVGRGHGHSSRAYGEQAVAVEPGKTILSLPDRAQRDQTGSESCPPGSPLSRRRRPARRRRRGPRRAPVPSPPGPGGSARRRGRRGRRPRRPPTSRRASRRRRRCRPPG